jgi:hypothetical protein
MMLMLAAAAAWLARRALRRAAPYAEVMSALWAACGLLLLAGTANTAKTRAVEDRLNALVPRIPVPQAAPATGAAGGQASGGNSSYSTSNGSYSTSNGSYSVAGQNTIPGAPGGANAAWYSAVNATVGALFGAFNAIQSSYSNTIPAINALQGSYSTTISSLNSLVADHNALVTDHKNLKTTLTSSGILT